MSNILELTTVSKVYGMGHTAVKAVNQVDLEVQPGEIVLIMGSSGSGKTTLLSIAGLLLKPSSGEVWISRNKINSMSQRQLSELRLRSFGFVFQANNLLGALTARENVEVVMIMAGRKGRIARGRADELLTILGMGEGFNHKPVDLSGGEKQRVAIARA